MEEKLNHPSGKDTDSKRHDRLLKGVIEEKDGKDDGDIEEDGSNGRSEKVASGVENSHAEGKEPHEEKIGEDDLIECDGQLKLFWNSGKSRRDDLN